jgi:hypothetical protein
MLIPVFLNTTEHANGHGEGGRGVDNPICEKEEIFPKYVDSGKGFMATPPADILLEKCSLVSLQQVWLIEGIFSL